MVGNWKEQALKLYNTGKKITEIAEELNLSRKTISKYINSLPCSALSSVKEKRTEISKNRRKEQKKAYRDKTTEKQKAQLKRQHEIDVMVLSRERFFD